MTALAEAFHMAVHFKETAMRRPELHILVVENQYLIAMEVERILVESLECQVNICACAKLEDELAAAAYGVVIIDAAPSADLNRSRAQHIASTGAAVVFLSSYDELAQDPAPIEGAMILTKPLDADLLPRTIVTAVGARND
ncbi:MAG TPA: hypothetical protein DIC56_12270 [Rhizobium sp.]|nr:hypothetical protein [Rhizobium sp.]